GLTSLIVRGALWTFGYELMLLAFTPLERLLRRALSTRVRRVELRSPFSAVPGTARVGGAAALACAGVAVPVTLLAGANAPGPAAVAASTHRVVVVKRRWSSASSCARPSRCPPRPPTAPSPPPCAPFPSNRPSGCALRATSRRRTPASCRSCAPTRR